MPRCAVSISSIATPAAGPSFAVPISDEALDASWVQVTDELDIATGPALQQTLARGAGRFAADAGRPSRGRFMDRTRVHVIVDATVHAGQRDCRLAVAWTAHRGRLLALPGTTGLVEIVELDTGEPPPRHSPSSPAGMRPHECSPRAGHDLVAAGARGQVIDRRAIFQTNTEDEFTAVIERLTDRRCRSAAHRRRIRLSPSQPLPVRAGRSR